MNRKYYPNNRGNKQKMTRQRATWNTSKYGMKPMNKPKGEQKNYGNV